jgi:hypothetical protein
MYYCLSLSVGQMFVLENSFCSLHFDIMTTLEFFVVSIAPSALVDDGEQ